MCFSFSSPYSPNTSFLNLLSEMLLDSVSRRSGSKGLVINYREEGYKMGKLRARNCLRLSSRQVKTFSRPPLLKTGNFLRPIPLSLSLKRQATTVIKTTPKLAVPLLQHGLNFFRPPPFVGVKLHIPPPLPVFIDRSLTALIPYLID